MSSLHSPCVRLACGFALLLLASCSSTSWPRQVKFSARPGQSAYPMLQAMESAQIATTAGKHEEALAGWLRTAREAALLIEDKTTCGDGSISRIKVTQAYQHALGEVLASSPSAVTKGRMEIHVSHQGSIIRKAALASVKPAPAMREYSGLRVGVPVDVMFAGDTSVPAGRYVAVLLFPSSNGSPVLELRPTQTGGALRLHPPGPLMPLREAAPL